MGRRSFWRRQRKRESELTSQENKVAKMLMEDEHVTIHVLSEYLDGIYESKFAKTFKSHIREIFALHGKFLCFLKKILKDSFIARNFDKF